MYPIMLDLSKRSVLIVGGGKIAARKIVDLLVAEASITVISPEVDDGIPCDRLMWQERVYQDGDSVGYDLIFACTDDPLLNEQIAKACEPWQLVNNTSQKAQSTFYNMATVSLDEVVYGVSTYGKEPGRAKEAKNALKSWLQTKRQGEDQV